MNIAFILESFFPEAGGNERSTLEIIEQLVQRGHHVTVLASRGRSDINLPHLRLTYAHRIRTRSARGLRQFAQWAVRQLADGRFDTAVSTTLSVPAPIVQPRSGTMRETQRQNVAMRRGALARSFKSLCLALSPKQRALLAAERATLTSPYVRRIVAISQYVADQIFHHYTIPARKVLVIPNAARFTPLTPEQRLTQRTQARRAMNFTDEDTVFLFAAMNPRLKGYDPLLTALRQLLRTHPTARLIVAGPPGHTASRAAAALDIAHAVRCVGPTEEMTALYQAADAAVLPSYYDSSNKVILEALLNGKPAISTLFAGASQWIFSPDNQHTIPSPFDADHEMIFNAPHPQAGRVIDRPDNIPALVEAMKDLCNPEQRAACAAAARGIAQHISVEAHVDQLETLMNEVARES